MEVDRLCGPAPAVTASLDSVDQFERSIRTAVRAGPAVSRPLRRYLCLEDFEPVARKRLPRQIYGYYAGAAETGAAFRAGQDAYRQLALTPRVLVDTRDRSTAKPLFGSTYSLPVGIAPMGLSGLSTFQGDLALAKAARAEGALMVVSATSLMPLERLASDGGARWFQAYLPGEPDRIEAMVSRVAAAGYDTLVLTVDVPVAANRENNVRTGFSIPLKPTPRLLLDGVIHAPWSLMTFGRTLLNGVPRFENMDAFRGPAVLSRKVERAIGDRDGLSWRHLELMRRLWQGKLVVKGILSPDDVALARQAGVDGVWISNHGGRQLDSAIAPLAVLREAAQQAGGMAVMIDGGIRRGTDVLKALALGADFVFVGRPFMFAAAAAGQDGVRHALQLLQMEIARDMAMLGINRLDAIGPHFVKPAEALP
jgi:L-lactate dehydrogenase (cytochrome)